MNCLTINKFIMDYTVITDNGGGEDQIYHDVEGEIYTFPPMYKMKLLPGTQVVYHRNKKTPTSPNIPTRMSDDSHYFGVAEIGKLSILTSRLKNDLLGQLWPPEASKSN